MDQPTGQENNELLTTEDVLNKNFQSVKFREGYDPIEVDEFLDRVVATIYYLTVENVSLREQLEAANRHIQELSSGSPVAQQSDGFTTEAPTTLSEQHDASPASYSQPVADAPAQSNDTESASTMLALAQRVHDQYVREGREESDKIVNDARVEGRAIVADAEKQHNDTLARLDQERGLLEKKINELRGFESEYRKAIKHQLKDLLAQVDSPPLQ